MKAPPRDSYLRVALLSGVVLLGWIWDFALGGGRAHAVGWLIALLVVAGVMALVVRSARSERLPDPASTLAISAPGGTALPEADSPATVGDSAPDVALGVRLASSADLLSLAGVQRSSSALFTVSGLTAPPPVELPPDTVLFAAGDPAAGFLALAVVDGDAHVAGVWVVPGSMRRGVGSALLRAAERHAADCGHRRVTTVTTDGVEWQAGFFGHHGYLPIEPGPELAQDMAGRSERCTALAKSPTADVGRFGAAGTMTG